MKRCTQLERITKETKINVSMDFDSKDKSSITTGVGFFDHMLDQLAKHSGIQIIVTCEGDTYIDDHHTIEDVSICLGQAFKKCLGTSKGIRRFGYAYCPLDESLSRAVVDISGRGYASTSLLMTHEKVGDMHVEMIPHFFSSFASAAQITIHIDQIKGSNHHHMVESSFKAFAVALKSAIEIVGSDMPSTKGIIDNY